MVERLGKLLAEYHISISDGHYHYVAQKVIEAMREPTEAMLTAAVYCDNRTDVGDSEGRKAFKQEWTAALDAALEQ